MWLKFLQSEVIRILVAFPFPFAKEIQVYTSRLIPKRNTKQNPFQLSVFPIEQAD